MEKKQNLVSAENLSVKLGERIVLSHLNFSIGENEIVTIVGPNGSGKTTFLRALIGAVDPSEGKVTKTSNLRIGYVPQNLHIDGTFPMTVSRFLSLPGNLAKSLVLNALQHAGVPDIGDRQMETLSTGQFQRVLLARALRDNPQLLILDEATQGLDQPGAVAFYRQIESVRSDLGCAVLMVSHELHVVMSASDRVICLNGHICCQGAPETVAAAPEYQALFGSGTMGALALYRHEHNHSHDHDHLSDSS